MDDTKQADAAYLEVLRDEFAGRALAALINEQQWSNDGNALVNVLGENFCGSCEDRYAHASYLMADAMLRARSKT